MKKTIEVDVRWWTFRQNNSGGYCIVNDQVAEYVFVEAVDADDAIRRAEVIFSDYSEYCECCGERWDYWVDEGDGYDNPSIYGEPYKDCKFEHLFEKQQGYRFHYMDGTVKAETVYRGEDGTLCVMHGEAVNMACDVSL